jgi:hypothetical protein
MTVNDDVAAQTSRNRAWAITTSRRGICTEQEQDGSAAEQRPPSRPSVIYLSRHAAVGNGGDKNEKGYVRKIDWWVAVKKLFIFVVRKGQQHAVVRRGYRRPKRSIDDREIVFWIDANTERAFVSAYDDCKSFDKVEFLNSNHVFVQLCFLTR